MSSPNPHEITTLVEAALLGTQRAKLSNLQASSPQLNELLNQLKSANDEQKLLSAAAAIGLYATVGQLPARRLDVPPPTTPAEGRHPICGREATRCLTMMLDNQFVEALPEFLTSLHQANQRAPEELLPALLDRGARTAPQRRLIEKITGPTGQWLAHQNPAWAYAAPETRSWDGLSKLWRKEGSATSRQALLRQTRESNPELGRQLLESTWKSEQPTNRAWFIRVLETGLSMADEPFLEAALDARNNTVRRKAAELLSRLTDSRLCKRMTINSESVLIWSEEEESSESDLAQDEKGGEEAAPMLGVRFPDKISPQMARDGVLPRDSKKSSRIRGSQLTEMIQAVPLEKWCQRWQKTPEEIIAAAQKSRWPRTIIGGFALAALRQKNVAWAEILLNADQYTLSTINLIPLLSDEAFTAIVTELDAAAAPDELLDKNSVLIRVLRKWARPWSEPIGRIWLRQQLRHLQLEEAKAANATAVAESPPEKSEAEEQTKEPVKDAAAKKRLVRSDSLLHTLNKQSAINAPPALIDEIIDQLLPYATLTEAWKKSIDQAVALLRFRRRMLNALEVSLA